MLCIWICEYFQGKLLTDGKLELAFELIQLLLYAMLPGLIIQFNLLRLKCVTNSLALSFRRISRQFNMFYFGGAQKRFRSMDLWGVRWLQRWNYLLLIWYGKKRNKFIHFFSYLLLCCDVKRKHTFPCSLKYLRVWNSIPLFHTLYQWLLRFERATWVGRKGGVHKKLD